MRNQCVRLVAIVSMLMISISMGAQRYDIIPKPKKLIEREGDFQLVRSTLLNVSTGDSAFIEVARDFARHLKTATGYTIAVNNGKEVSSSSQIEFDKVDGMGEEAYSLSISKRKIVITSSTAHGAYYGVQTICQLLPAEIYDKRVAKKVKWQIPCCEIQDEPRFEYRGMMLDCARYFMPKEFVKKFIDLLSMHKQNVFHWHLTDDQGWRIEIKKYPKLTKVGSWRPETTGYDTDRGDHTPHGGFYTQQDIREIVEYARHHFVTIVPEIELPGHATAALAAYPELAVFPDRHYEVATGWGVKKDIMSPTVKTFQFLEDVFSELFPLFPSPYYSIGGDECPRDQWRESPHCQDLMKILGTEDAGDLQTLFVQHMDKFLREKGGKRVIGWDEILDNGAVPSTIVLSYRGHAPAGKAVWQNMNAVMCPNRWCYLDYYQEDTDKEPKAQGLFLPLRKVYNYFPIGDTLSQSRYKYILGVQGCIWTEFIQNPTRVEYMGYPRAVALSEVGWCDKGDKDWDSFSRRMLKEFHRLDMKEVAYSKAYFNVIFNYDHKQEVYPKKLELTLDYPDTEIHYTTDGSHPTIHSPLYQAALQVSKGVHIRARGFRHSGEAVGVEVDKVF
ncbi:beta-N-acetylhexosaminidase [Prevotella sp. KH2C16]|uniref:beta-N-acetylhexosaminidase n=1 Tax=Prevotella sp. KH2C16 TaxID=1855325 RepID=UPI0008E363C1|nr:family 20 glycosylhydrolase [Prevotella sp. KH2C16]SFG31083.1 hexosaminidase [Prevotella sp. KH2C16]